MFISIKRHEREKREIVGSSNRLADAILKSSTQGLFLLDSKDKIQPQVSQSLSTLFRRQDFTNLSFEKLIGPLVSAKTLSVARTHLLQLLQTGAGAQAGANPLQDVEVRLPNVDGSHQAAHYAFEFDPVDLPGEPRVWLVKVTDITARAQESRELDDLRTQTQIYGEILRSVLQGGSARFGAFLQRTQAAMNCINGVLKKPAREADAFRNKLEETLDEVDRVRRDAAALKLAAFEAAARRFEDSLQDLRSRRTLSGSDFLPLAVKLDQLYGQFALIRQITTQAGPASEPPAHSASRVTDNGTQILEAPKFLSQAAHSQADASNVPTQPAPQTIGPVAHRLAAAGSLESTLVSLTDLVAEEQQKAVSLECVGMHLVPARYQAAIKNIAIQLIRNAVMHGIESGAARSSAGKTAHGKLQLEFKAAADGSFELNFQDDGCGLDADKVRAVAVARGIISEEAAAKLRDRQAIKLIFKSGFSTLNSAAGEAPHGTGMSLVRRYVNEAGGKIALASLLGHETRFKVTLPPVALADSPEAASQVA